MPPDCPGRGGIIALASQARAPCLGSAPCAACLGKRAFVPLALAPASSRPVDATPIHAYHAGSPVCSRGDGFRRHPWRSHEPVSGDARVLARPSRTRWGHRSRTPLPCGRGACHLGTVLGPDLCATMDRDRSPAGGGMPFVAGTTPTSKDRQSGVAPTDARHPATLDAGLAASMAATWWMPSRGVGRARLVSRRAVSSRGRGRSRLVPCPPASTNPPGVARCAP